MCCWSLEIQRLYAHMHQIPICLIRSILKEQHQEEVELYYLCIGRNYCNAKKVIEAELSSETVLKVS